MVSTDPKPAWIWSLASGEMAKEIEMVKSKSELILVPKILEIDEVPYFDLMVDHDLEKVNRGSSLDKVLLDCKISVKDDVDQKSTTYEWRPEES